MNLFVITSALFLLLLIGACKNKTVTRIEHKKANFAIINKSSFVFDTAITKDLHIGFTISKNRLYYTVNHSLIDSDTLIEKYNSETNRSRPVYGIDINDPEQKEHRTLILDSLVFFSLHILDERGFNVLYVCSYKKNNMRFLKNTFEEKKASPNVIFQCPYYFVDTKSNSFFLILQDIKDLEKGTGYTPVYKYKCIGDSIKFDGLVLKLKMDSAYSNITISKKLRMAKPFFK